MKHVPIGNRGSYQTGYQSGSAFHADRRSNEESRVLSNQVANGNLGMRSFWFFHGKGKGKREKGKGKKTETKSNQAPQDCGLKSPSIFAREIANFDVTYGYILEFMHKICVVALSFFNGKEGNPTLELKTNKVIPTTFWKKLIFQSYKNGEMIGDWVMTKENRRIMGARIKKIKGIQKMKRLRDPSCEKMKGPFDSFAFAFLLFHSSFEHS